MIDWEACINERRTCILRVIVLMSPSNLSRRNDMLESVKEDGWEDGEAVEGKVETPEEGEDEDGGLPGGRGREDSLDVFPEPKVVTESESPRRLPTGRVTGAAGETSVDASGPCFVA